MGKSWKSEALGQRGEEGAWSDRCLGGRLFFRAVVCVSSGVLSFF